MPPVFEEKSFAVTTHGAEPPMVTVIASIDCLPLAAVMTSSPHCAAGWLRCWTAQLGTPVGFTVPTIWDRVQVVTFVSATPPTVTAGQLPEAGQVLGRLPKP